MASPQLFEDVFHEWLTVNGVSLGDLIGDISQPAAQMRFLATVDLNALKVGIIELVLRSGGSICEI